MFVIGSKNVLISNTMADNTILDSPDELLRLTLSFLGVGHFAFVALVCSRFKIAHLANVGDEMITSGESVTSSILRAEKYFEDAGTDSEHLIFFWLNVTRYGRVDVMEWAHREGYSRVWNEGFRGRNVGDQLCRRAAEYGQLAGLQWLRQNGCSWSSGTSSAAAGGRMDANGTVVLVQLQLKVGISPSSNGRERMNVPGKVTHTMQLEDTVTQMCSHTSWVVTGRL